MHCLLLIAHGSRRAASNDEVRSLTQLLRRQAGTQFAEVECAFLELAEPSIPDAIDAAITRGCDTLTLLPYFLAAGTHVVNDIPAILADKRAQYPHISLHLGPHLGGAQGMVPLLLSMVSEQQQAQQ